MKVKINENSKMCLYCHEMPTAKKIVEEMKDDESTTKDYAKMALNLFGSGNWQIFTAEAAIAKNIHIYNQYSEESAHIDIWVQAQAFSYECGFYEIGAYLSDIWQIGGEDAEELKSRMFVNAYTKN